MLIIVGVTSSPSVFEFARICFCARGTIFVHVVRRAELAADVNYCRCHLLEPRIQPQCSELWPVCQQLAKQPIYCSSPTLNNLCATISNQLTICSLVLLLEIYKLNNWTNSLCPTISNKLTLLRLFLQRGILRDHICSLVLLFEIYKVNSWCKHH